METRRRLITTVGGGGLSYIQKVLNIQRANMILYHPMNESSGGVANDYSPENNDGAYTGVTLGQPGIGDGNTCPLFDGANDYNNIYSAAFNADFDGQEGTVAGWIKVNNVGVWTDGIARCVAYFYVDGANNIYIRRQTTNNRLRFMRNANGTLKFIDVDGLSNVNWMHVALTWSKSDDEVKAYINGSQQGATQTGLDNWSGNLSSASTCIGANGTGPGQVWHGWLAHAPIWKVALSAAKIADLAVV